MSLRNTSTFAPLLLIAAMSSACQTSKEDDSRSGFHDVTVTWRLKNLDGTVMTACPPGFTTLVVHLYRAGFVEPPDALLKIPCTPEGSLTQPVATAGELLAEETRDSAHGYYDYTPQKDVWIDITEETQSQYAAVSFMYYVESLTADATIDFELYPAGGVGVATWSLSSTLTSARLSSCATAGVDEIEAAVRPFADDTAPLVVAGTWPCDAIDPYFHYDPDGNSSLFDPDELELGTGHTRGFAPDSYFVEMRAKRAGVIVGTAEASFSSDGENSAHRINGDDIKINDR